MQSLCFLLLASLLQVSATTTTDRDCGSPAHQAFFVVGCAKPIVVERADPIVHPGAPAEHVHTIMGGDAFDLTLDFNRTQTSECTTCVVTKDLSNYWIPTVYFHAANGSFVSVKQVGGLNIYYQERMDWTDYCAGKKLQPFPRDFRMITGDRLRRRFVPSSLEQAGVQFICLQTHGRAGLEPFFGFPVGHTCPGGLQIRIRFPSCWDGRRVDSPDHKAHVAFPSDVDNGPCPKTHPVRIPALLYESTWHVEPFDGLPFRGRQPFVLSQGDPTGFGYHADFLNGWDVDLLEGALRDPSCGNGSGGRIDVCETLMPFLQSGRVQNLCPSLEQRVVERVDGLLDRLPGCNPVQYGPRDAVVMECKRTGWWGWWG
ncbi:hypothetical protein QBC47DRAFT_306703 [Echria macrotheca]|uniref:DUF1996 domain-containing protein n=1 Tax=Echria macrotheca TaxID=438768 RepID=A0AAJ0F8N2_9PEZI|nr:hypothetical protein QBC47DRAFT_306703 [Echria macrotheca]